LIFTQPETLKWASIWSKPIVLRSGVIFHAAFFSLLYFNVGLGFPRIEVYRDLLDQWRLWTERASFDVARRCDGRARAPGQVLVRCNFCNIAITGPAVRGPKTRAPNQTRCEPKC
jgi:hypothetical protein